MAGQNGIHSPEADALFDAILTLRSREDCYKFFADLCTIKELTDMAQRLQAAKMLLDGCTYEQIAHSADISTATISRINRCIQYGEGGYRETIARLTPAPAPKAAPAKKRG